MLINRTTGEIAYHSILFKKTGGVYVKQYPLKKRRKSDKIEYIKPKLYGRV